MVVLRDVVICHLEKDKLMIFYVCHHLAITFYRTPV